MPPEGFEPAIPAGERLQTHALERSATGIGSVIYFTLSKFSSIHYHSDKLGSIPGQFMWDIWWKKKIATEQDFSQYSGSTLSSIAPTYISFVYHRPYTILAGSVVKHSTTDTTSISKIHLNIFLQYATITHKQSLNPQAFTQRLCPNLQSLITNDTLTSLLL